MDKSNYIKLGTKIVSSKSKPYIIAEIGVNHEGSIDLAFKLIDQAKEEVQMRLNSKVIKLIP